MRLLSRAELQRAMGLKVTAPPLSEATKERIRQAEARYRTSGLDPIVQANSPRPTMSKSERITVVIETGNAAFDDTPATEIGRILIQLGQDYQERGHPRSERLFDYNGNCVGSVSTKEQTDEEE